MKTIVLDNYFLPERTSEIGQTWVKTDSTHTSIANAKTANERHRESIDFRFKHKYRVSLVQTIQTVILED